MNVKKVLSILLIIVIIVIIIAITIKLLIIGYYSKFKKLINYVVENLSYIGGMISAISIFFTYFKYRNDKSDKKDKKIEQTMDLIDDFIENIYPIMNKLDNIKNNRNDSYKTMFDDVLKDENLITKSDISQVKYLSFENNDRKKIRDVIAQTYAVKNIDKFDRFESWSKHFLLLDREGLINSEDIKQEYETTILYYMEHFSAGIKLVDSDKQLFSSFHELYKKWSGKDIF